MRRRSLRAARRLVPLCKAGRPKALPWSSRPPCPSESYCASSRMASGPAKTKMREKRSKTLPVAAAKPARFIELPAVRLATLPTAPLPLAVWPIRSPRTRLMRALSPRVRCLILAKPHCHGLYPSPGASMKIQGRFPMPRQSSHTVQPAGKDRPDQSRPPSRPRRQRRARCRPEPPRQPRLLPPGTLRGRRRPPRH